MSFFCFLAINLSIRPLLYQLLTAIHFSVLKLRLEISADERIVKGRWIFVWKLFKWIFCIASWEKYVGDFEYGVHGWQDKGYKILKCLSRTERCSLQLTMVTEDECLRYYKKFWTNDETVVSAVTAEINEHVDVITLDELAIFIQNSKNKNPQEVTEWTFNLSSVHQHQCSYTSQILSVSVGKRDTFHRNGGKQK